MKNVCIGLMMLVATTAAAQETVSIVSQQQLDDRIPIAIPEFAAAPGMEGIGVQMANLVAEDIAFSGLFNILPRADYPASFTGFTQDPSQIRFDDWKTTGVDYLVHAYVAKEGGQFALYARVFDVFSGQQAAGKLFSVDSEQHWRRVGHRFSDEVLLKLDGTAGCASAPIVFSSPVSGKKELFIADYDGANVRRLTQHNSISILPNVSPDGRSVAYTSFKDRYAFLYLLDLPTGESRSLSKSSGLNASPAWHPNGQRLAVVLSKDTNMEIYMVNRDGSGRQRLTNHPALDTSPTFSPDGNRIAFVSERGGNAQIYVMGADGSSASRLSFQGGNSVDPEWSPDGNYIAYVVEKRGAGTQIYVMDADGRNARQLTASRGTNESPSWSPDSRHIVFKSTRSGHSELWTVTLLTGEQRKVPINAVCEGPSWGPRQ